MNFDFFAIPIGAISGIIAYVVALLILQNKFPTRMECGVKHELIEKLIGTYMGSINARLDRLEQKLDRIVEDRDG